MRVTVKSGEVQSQEMTYPQKPPKWEERISLHFDIAENRTVSFLLTLEEAEGISEEIYHKVRQARTKDWRKQRTKQ